MSATYEDVLGRLREERLRLSLSQMQMGQLLHMSQSHYSKIELGSRRLTFAEMKDLCRTKVDVHYIFTGERGSEHYRDLFVKCDYVELICCVNIVFSVSLFSGKEGIRQPWKTICEKTMFLQYVEEGHNFNKNLFYSLRRGMDIRQQKMAEKLGVDIKKLRDLENGRCLPDSEILFRMYQMFQVPPAFFLKDKKNVISFICILMDMLNEEQRIKLLSVLKVLLSERDYEERTNS